MQQNIWIHKINQLIDTTLKEAIDSTQIKLYGGISKRSAKEAIQALVARFNISLFFRAVLYNPIKKIATSFYSTQNDNFKFNLEFTKEFTKLLSQRLHQSDFLNHALKNLLQLSDQKSETIIREKYNNLFNTLSHKIGNTTLGKILGTIIQMEMKKFIGETNQTQDEIIRIQSIITQQLTHTNLITDSDSLLSTERVLLTATTIKINFIARTITGHTNIIDALQDEVRALYCLTTHLYTTALYISNKDNAQQHLNQNQHWICRRVVKPILDYLAQNTHIVFVTYSFTTLYMMLAENEPDHYDNATRNLTDNCNQNSTITNHDMPYENLLLIIPIGVLYIGGIASLLLKARNQISTTHTLTKVLPLQQESYLQHINTEFSKNNFKTLPQRMSDISRITRGVSDVFTSLEHILPSSMYNTIIFDVIPESLFTPLSAFELLGDLKMLTKLVIRQELFNNIVLPRLKEEVVSKPHAIEHLNRIFYTYFWKDGRCSTDLREIYHSLTHLNLETSMRNYKLRAKDYLIIKFEQYGWGLINMIISIVQFTCFHSIMWHSVTQKRLNTQDNLCIDNTSSITCIMTYTENLFQSDSILLRILYRTSSTVIFLINYGVTRYLMNYHAQDGLSSELQTELRWYMIHSLHRLIGDSAIHTLGINLHGQQDMAAFCAGGICTGFSDIGASENLESAVQCITHERLNKIMGAMMNKNREDFQPETNVADIIHNVVTMLDHNLNTHLGQTPSTNLRESRAANSVMNHQQPWKNSNYMY